jgi:hypothetical protein
VEPQAIIPDKAAADAKADARRMNLFMVMSSQCPVGTHDPFWEVKPAAQDVVPPPVDPLPPVVGTQVPLLSTVPEPQVGLCETALVAGLAVLELPQPLLEPHPTAADKAAAKIKAEHFESLFMRPPPSFSATAIV